MTEDAPKDLLTTFHGWCLGKIDATGDGMWPLPAVAKRADGKLVVFALDLEPHQIMPMMASEAGRPDTVEVAFALDRYAKPGQDVEWESLLTVYHWTHLTGWRVGVVEYRAEPEPEAKPYDWNNKFWRRVTHRDLRGLNLLTGMVQDKSRRTAH